MDKRGPLPTNPMSGSRRGSSAGLVGSASGVGSAGVPASSRSDSRFPSRPLSAIISMPGKMGKKVVGMIMRVPKAATAHHLHKKTKKKIDGLMVTSSGMGKASLYHALVVIFLEFFAWGLLTSPMITVLNETFPDHTFLMNGLIMGIKGLLSFLSAPLIGALSDIWGRKFFLLVTVFFTCIPIPLMRINSWWYFALISISGIFAVTFSVVFAYVADVTEESERSSAYGLVSATFAASLVTSPALGAWIEQEYSEDLVVAAATAIAILDVFFIMVAVPESLPDPQLTGGGGTSMRAITLEQVDPFSSLRKMWKDSTVLMLCITVFFSYLPEAGQYSCFFVYLRLVMNFSKEQVALFIAAIGILSVAAQTGLLTCLMKTIGPKHTIIIGLFFEMLQLMWYGFGSQPWMMWSAGILASISSITYPAISAFVSMHADADKQGLVQGMITGIRGLCNGLGPAMYGLIFYLFHVDLSEQDTKSGAGQGGQVTVGPNQAVDNGSIHHYHPLDVVTALMPGPPFVFGAFLVILAILVAAFIPESAEFRSSSIFSSSSYLALASEEGGATSRYRRRSGRGVGRSRSNRRRKLSSSLEDEDEDDEESLHRIPGHAARDNKTAARGVGGAGVGLAGKTSDDSLTSDSDTEFVLSVDDKKVDSLYGVPSMCAGGSSGVGLALSRTHSAGDDYTLPLIKEDDLL